MKKAFFAIILVVTSVPAIAQDLQLQEVVVTAQRREQDDYSDYMPAVGLRREADFLVQEVTIRGDTRDADPREKEIRAMLTNAIKAAERMGFELATGDYILTKLTVENASELALAGDRRPDSQRIDFLIKASLKGISVSTAQAKIRDFIKSVPEVGRAQMDELGDPTLSIVGPDKYRQEIITLVVKDANQQAQIMGDGYGVELTGLNMPVQWARSGPGEVLLYIPYEMKVVPRP